MGQFVRCWAGSSHCIPPLFTDLCSATRTGSWTSCSLNCKRIILTHVVYRLENNSWKLDKNKLLVHLKFCNLCQSFNHPVTITIQVCVLQFWSSCGFRAFILNILHVGVMYIPFQHSAAILLWTLLTASPYFLYRAQGPTFGGIPSVVPNSATASNLPLAQVRRCILILWPTSSTLLTSCWTVLV